MWLSRLWLMLPLPTVLVWLAEASNPRLTPLLNVTTALGLKVRWSELLLDPAPPASGVDDGRGARSRVEPDPHQADHAAAERLRSS